MKTDAHNKKGWSWLGFFFMPYYYAGYGALTKGIIAAAVLGLAAGIQDINHMALIAVSLVVWFAVAIYGGLKSKEELPVKVQKFNWLKVMLAMFIYAIGVVISSLFLVTLDGNTPACNSVDAKALVTKIIRKNARELGLGDVSVSLSNIRTSKYNGGIDKYTCEADIRIDSSVGGNADSVTYTIQMTDDGEHFYVEVFGL